jgi:hypothetical protein
LRTFDLASLRWLGACSDDASRPSAFESKMPRTELRISG